MIFYFLGCLFGLWIRNFKFKVEKYVLKKLSICSMMEMFDSVLREVYLVLMIFINDD